MMMNDMEEDPKEVLRVKNMPAREDSTLVEREKHKCRESEKAADYGCNTVVPAVCCKNGFLREED